MYYFESDTSVEPQGVIDMEYITDISVESDNIIKIGAATGFEQRLIYLMSLIYSTYVFCWHLEWSLFFVNCNFSSRTFFFQSESPVTSNEWASSMQRDRYDVVRDERNAYQQLQDQFSSQVSSIIFFVNYLIMWTNKLCSIYFILMSVGFRISTCWKHNSRER